MIAPLLTMLETLANPIRLEVISFLQTKEKANYSELMQACHLRPYSESGKFSYHLHNLLSDGLIAKVEDEYGLTEKGKKASQLIRTVEKNCKELFLSQNETERKIAIERLAVREATYPDLPSLIELGKVGYGGLPDYHVAVFFAGIDGLKEKAFCAEHGKGRLILIAEYEEKPVGYCIVDLISLAYMKAEYLANIDSEKLPKELAKPMTQEEKKFYQKYWEANSALIATLTATNYLEIEYGVTGSRGLGSGPIELIFTRKRFDTGDFVTADTKKILHEMLLCEEIEERAVRNYSKTLENTDFGGTATCYEIVQLFVRLGFDEQGIDKRILGYLEKKATEQKMTYLITAVSPSEIEKRRFWKDNGFTEHYQPKFEHKHAGRIETYVEIKKTED